MTDRDERRALAFLDLMRSWTQTARMFEREARECGWGAETVARCNASASRLRECADELGRACLAATRDWDEHPPHYDGPCECLECRSRLEAAECPEEFIE